jgi:23S rRNA (guanosine2251-2'-O)-methyltransferase
MNTYLILHNIRSRYNVGSIFRSADGAGVTKIFISGYTPAPIDRFGRAVREIHKTSLGATDTVPWEEVPSVEACIGKLKDENVHVIALELHERAVPYATYVYPENVALILGNEIEGVSPMLCEHAEDIVYVPMHGAKESLNVGVATAIVLFEIQRQFKLVS